MFLLYLKKEKNLTFIYTVLSGQKNGLQLITNKIKRTAQSIKITLNKPDHKILLLKKVLDSFLNTGRKAVKMNLS